MKNNNLREMTKEQLVQKISVLDKLIGIILGLQFVIIAAGIYLFFQNRSIISVLLPIVVIPITIIPIAIRNKYVAELAGRK